MTPVKVLSGSGVVLFITVVVVVSLLIPNLSAAPLVGKPTAQAGPTPSAGFHFPYQYQQPSVPSNVGAQGVHGPTVPLSQIGVSGQLGSTGHIGPVNTTNPYFLSGISSTVEFHVLDGSTSSSSPSTGANIYLVNITTGRNYTATANSQGYANISATQGWYYLTIAPSVYGSWINFEQQTLIQSANQLLTRYLLPDSQSTVTVNNGGTGIIWFLEQTNSGLTSQLSVSLLNESSSGSTIASGSTMSNGSIEFTGVNSAFSYAFSVDGYSNPSTSVRYYMTNHTTNPVSMSGNELVYHDSGVMGISSTTGATSGVTPPAGGSSWSISSHATITGGTTYISSQLSWGSSAALTFVNAVVLINMTSTAAGNPSFIRFDNSTVYFISQSTEVFSSSRTTPLIQATHTTFFGIAITSLPVSTGGLILGFTNVSHSLFYYMDSNYNGAVYGNFFNDTILNSTEYPLAVGNASRNNINSHFDWNVIQQFSYVSIINSILKGGNIHTGQAEFYRSLLSNSSTEISLLRINATELMLNMTPEPNANSFNAHWLNMTHSSVIFSTPQNETFIQYALTIPSDLFANPPGAGPWLQDMTFDNAGNNMGVGANNITYSYFGRTYPAINLTFTFGGSNGRTSLYNDWLNFNWTWSEYTAAIRSYYTENDGGIWPNPATTIPFTDGQTVFQSFGQLSVNYSVCDMGGNSWFQLYSHMTGNAGVTSYFEHDTFPWTQIQQNQYSPFVLFPSNNPGQVDISNTTFGYIYWNWTAWVPGNNQEGEAMIWMDTATSQNLQPSPYINITHDTFEAPSFGAGSNGMAGIVQFAKYGIIGDVSFCKFMNSPDYVVMAPDITNASNYRGWYLPPHQDDILASAANVTIHDNYFLNLTNLTMPFGSDQAYQHGGFSGNTTEYNNHFFYYPLPGMSYINETWGFSNVGYYGSHTPSVNGNNVNGYNGSHLAYEIPVGQQATMTVQSGGAYIYNSSINQLPPSSYVVNDKGWSSGQPSQWSWIIEPNFVWNGSTYIAQYQGMGGPQPNLTYNGYHYQWAFEQNMTYISTTTSSASPIPLRWSLPNPNHLGGTVSLYQHNFSNNINTLLSTVSQGYYATNISYDYRPWANGLSAVFFLNGTNLNFTLPPATNYTISFTETGLPQGTNWSIDLNSQTQSSVSSSMKFERPNGTYRYTVASVAGWIPTVTSGNVTVNGADQYVIIAFSRVTYKLSFMESGLSGQTWNVTVWPTAELSAARTISFNEPNGTFRYVITPPANYTSNVTSGIVTIQGSPVTIQVSFLKNASTSPPTNTTGTIPSPRDPNPVLFSIGGLEVHTYDAILISVALVSLAIVGAVVWRIESRRSR